MNKFLSVFAILIMLVAASCQKAEMSNPANADTSSLVKQASIITVNGPLTASVNQEVSFNVSWPYTGNCEKFKSFKTSTLKDTTHIKLFIATNPHEDCTGKEVKRSSVYKFKAANPGTYILKFVGPDNKPGIIDTVKVK